MDYVTFHNFSGNCKEKSEYACVHTLKKYTIPRNDTKHSYALRIVPIHTVWPTSLCVYTSLISTCVLSDHELYALSQK